MNNVAARLDEYTAKVFKYQDFDSKQAEYCTICSECKNNGLNNCHVVCNCISFGEKIIGCRIFAWNNRQTKKVRKCTVCGHSVKFHRHSKQFAAMREREAEIVETENTINELESSINKIKKQEIKLKLMLVDEVKHIVELSQELESQHPMTLINDDICDYYQERMSKTTTSIDEYSRLLRLYSMRSDFCLFFNEFRNDKHGGYQKVVECLFDKVVINDLINNGCRLVLQIFSESIVGMDNHNYNYNYDQDVEDMKENVMNQSIHLENTEKWSNLWVTHKRAFDIIHKTVKHLFLFPESMKSSSSLKTMLKVFDCDILFENIMVYIKTQRDLLLSSIIESNNYSNINVGDGFDQIHPSVIKAVQVEP